MTRFKRHTWLIAAATVALLIAITCALTESNAPKGPEGRQVSLTDPKVSPGNAVFLFWYGCPHCRAVEDSFSKQDADTKFKRALKSRNGLVMVPAPINSVWELHARLFYALSHQGVSNDTHRLMMAIIQDRGLASKEQMKVAISAAIEAQAHAGKPLASDLDSIFLDLYSERTGKEIEAAKKLVSQIGLKGVPSLLLNNSVMLELGNGVTYENLLPTALEIIKGKQS